MPLGRTLVRVVFVQTSANYPLRLSEFLSSEKNWEYFEFRSEMEEAWKRIITKSPDLTVFLFPVIGERERRCIGRVLFGCKTRIFVITYQQIDRDIDNRADRVDISVISGPESIRSAVYDLSRALDKTQVRGASAGFSSPASPMDGKIIAFGASTGGTESLEKVFRALPAEIPGIVVVQHMPPVFTKLYADRLNERLPHNVSEAEDNVQIRPGTIHIAPGDRHLLIKKRGASFYTSLGNREKVNNHCPSVDVLFESVAVEAGARAVGVILTGMGADGAKGLLSMRNRGAYTIGQDEASCVVYGMPKKAYEYGAVVRQAPLSDIARLLQAQVK